MVEWLSKNSLKKDMYPKIIFKYSHVYDRNWQKWFCIYNKPSRNVSFRKIQKYLESIGKLWPKYEKNILQGLCKITKLKWKEREIICYVVSDCRPFSDPLTLPVYDDKTRFIDVLVHELIHQLFSQNGNYEKAKSAWKYIDTKYKNESQLTKVHIPLSAIHQRMYVELFDKKRLARDVARANFFSDYRKAWEIVKKEGYNSVIEEFNSRVIK